MAKNTATEDGALQQLALLDVEESDFRLDRHTREIGKRGVAEARKVLGEVVRAAEERAQRAA